ncbi:hypothetical protein NQ318_014331 [Aromia moschata]|uniref:Reverse transcriptase zinc-binding domain-containing protein n=1 Tax=Aromia moschata TaxID=1265417 RepID=A0AAV8Z0A9_9CUCU|nr:hypothetical protein NQ318_014331 [Aromia moschata]
MLSVQMEQWVNLKFLIKLGKTFTEKCTGINVYPAHKFLNGLNGLKRDVKRPKTPGWPSTPKKDENIEKSALVISGTPPIRLQIKERARTYGKDEDAKRQEKEETIRKWQREWEDTVEVGQWTKRLIPNVATWTNRKHGNVDYYLTQMLSGHGCFAAYLHKFALIESDICWYCQERDDTAHTFLHCIRWTRERTIVETAIGETLSTENITNTMIDSKEGWDVIAQMAKGIISKKEEEERTRKRQLQGQE